MNFVDLIIIIFLLIYGVYGYFRGFIRVASELLFLFLSLFLAFTFNGKAVLIFRHFISVPPNLLKVISFLIVWIILEIIFSAAEYFIYKKIPQDIKSSSYNKYFGIPVAAFRSIFLVAVILTLFISFPVNGKIKEQILSSKFGSPLVSKTSDIAKKAESLLSGVVNETFTLLTVKPGTDESVDLKFKTSDLRVDEESERKMLELINQERIKRGVKALVMDEKIQEVARAHSRDMFEKGYFAHENLEGETPFDRMTKAGIKFITAGENLALAPNVELAHQGLMDSPGHRENILNMEFGKVGIGCQDGGIYGKMFTQDFTS